jgi:hypothetical protein
MPFLFRSACAVAFRLVVRTICLCSLRGLETGTMCVTYYYETSLDSRGFRTTRDNVHSLPNVAKIGTLTLMPRVPYKKATFLIFSVATLMRTREEPAGSELYAYMSVLVFWAEHRVNVGAALKMEVVCS